jgi:hypothetical protein
MLLSDRKAASKEALEMGLFPTRILLATDGSEEAELAALKAVDLAQRTDSGLHVAHRSSTQLPCELSRTAQLRGQALGADRRGVQGVAA